MNDLHLGLARPMSNIDPNIMSVPDESEIYHAGTDFQVPDFQLLDS